MQDSNPTPQITSFLCIIYIYNMSKLYYTLTHETPKTLRHYSVYYPWETINVVSLIYFSRNLSMLDLAKSIFSVLNTPCVPFLFESWTSLVYLVLMLLIQHKEICNIYIIGFFFFNLLHLYITADTRVEKKQYMY